MIGFEIAVVAVVVVQLLAHVEGAVGQRVVEQAEGQLAFLLPGQVERDMFVQRVGRTRAIAHRIDVAQAITLAHAIGVAGALADAEIHLVALTLQVVVYLFVPPAEVVGLRRPVGGHHLPDIA